MSKDITQNEVINAIVLMSENENVSEEVADFIESAAMAKLSGTDKHYGFYQLCPKCDGEGTVTDFTVSTFVPTVTRTCPVCNGEKLLVRPEIKKEGPGE